MPPMMAARGVVWLVVVVAALGALAGCGWVAGGAERRDLAEGLAAYEVGPVSFGYPQHWEVREETVNVDAEVAFVGEGDSGAMTVDLAEFEGPAPIEDYVRHLGLLFMQQAPDRVSLQDGAVEVAGADKAHLLVGDAESRNTDTGDVGQYRQADLYVQIDPESWVHFRIGARVEVYDDVPVEAIIDSIVVQAR